jgi:hypothetical protein
MLRKIFEPKMEGKAGHWRETDNKKFAIFMLTKY